ncbi:hypothetical protein [Thermostichus vulcanus]|nr:hypothetical protein [Thermostichus vulcanus]
MLLLFILHNSGGSRQKTACQAGQGHGNGDPQPGGNRQHGYEYD